MWAEALTEASVTKAKTPKKYPFFGTAKSVKDFQLSEHEFIQCRSAKLTVRKSSSMLTSVFPNVLVDKASSM